MTNFYFERAQFVVGEQDSGKSTQLRSMFRDVRLGTGGHIPDARNLPEIYRLSNERALYLRITSPHEWDESLEEFLDKTEEKMRSKALVEGRRWAFACALQPGADKQMPDVTTTCGSFTRRFNPERLRVVFLSPDRHGSPLQSRHTDSVVSMRDFPSIEVCWIDARSRTASGLMLADFFDFS
jgi:hypothetical protein